MEMINLQRGRKIESYRQIAKMIDNYIDRQLKGQKFRQKDIDIQVERYRHLGRKIQTYRQKDIDIQIERYRQLDRKIQTARQKDTFRHLDKEIYIDIQKERQGVRYGSTD